MTTTNQKDFIVSISIIGALFFIFGFITWLNGTLIPFLRLACDLQTDAQALLVTFAFYMAYFFLALPSAAILNVTGFKNGMAVGLLVMAIGCLVFIPAAMSRSYGMFLTGLFVQGMGLSLLQTASNPYITIIGPLESAAQRISIMGICNKVAGALGPLILSAVLLGDAADIEQQIAQATDLAMRTQLLNALAARVITPYIIMAVALALLAFMIKLSPLPSISIDQSESTGAQANKSSILQYPHLLLGVACIFVYVGAEVMAGDVIGLYGASMGMSLDETKNFTSYTLWSMVAGYCVGIFLIPKYIKQENALKWNAIIGMVFCMLAFFTSGYVSILFIALLGFANSIMWPAIWPMAISGLGKFTKIGSALLIMGIAGGALIPRIYGKLVDVFGLSSQSAFAIVVIPCYLFILYYAIKGHRAGRENPQLS